MAFGYADSLVYRLQLSAGGSLVHPEIPALLITPICPHTLSFRPMLLPDSMELRICVPYNSRSTAWASFDGRGRIELKRQCNTLLHIPAILTNFAEGDHIRVTASKYPFPTVCADKQSTDWFHSISRTLKWNERERQRSFVVVEEENEVKPDQRKRQIKAPERADESAEEFEEEDEVSEEEDDTFDINDLSPPEVIHLSPSANQISEDEEFDKSPKTTFNRVSSASQKNRRHASRSHSRSSLRSGVDVGPQPPPLHTPRHVEFNLSTSDSSTEDKNVENHLSRDGIHSRSARSRKGREFDPESKETPTSSTMPPGRGRPVSRSRSVDHPGRRAFAVWGHDESDSNASDSSTGAGE